MASIAVKIPNDHASDGSISTGPLIGVIAVPTFGLADDRGAVHAG